MKRIITLAAALILVLLLPLTAQTGGESSATDGSAAAGGTSAMDGASLDTLSIDVDSAVKMALENNISLRMSAIDLRTKRRVADTVWNSFLPSINASAGLTNSRVLFGDSTLSGTTLVPNYADPGVIPGSYNSVLEAPYSTEIDPTTSLNAGIQMSLPINMALGRGIRQTVLDYQAGQLSYEKAAGKLEVNIRKQFWLIKALEAGVELDRRNLETLQKRYDQTKVNYDNGLVPELSLLSARVSLENARPSLNRKISDLESNIAFFKFLIGVPRDRDISLEGELTVDIHDFNADELINRFINRRLDIQDIDHQILSLKNTLDMTRLYKLTPTLNFGLNWGTQVGSEPFKADSWDPFVDNLSLSMTLVWPLDGFIPGSKSDVGLKEIQDGIDSLLLAREQVYRNAGIEIENLVRSLRTSRSTLDAYAYNLDLARRNFQLNSEAYELGTVELLVLEDAQDNLYQAEYAVLFEKYNYLSALLDLEYAVNSSLNEIIGEDK